MCTCSLAVSRVDWENSRTAILTAAQLCGGPAPLLAVQKYSAESVFATLGKSWEKEGEREDLKPLIQEQGNHSSRVYLQIKITKHTQYSMLHARNHDSPTRIPKISLNNKKETQIRTYMEK